MKTTLDYLFSSFTLMTRATHSCIQQIPTAMKRLAWKMLATRTHLPALRPNGAHDFARTFSFSCAIALAWVGTAIAQLDPEPRKILHIGLTQPIRDDGPQAHYLFYYW